MILFFNQIIIIIIIPAIISFLASSSSSLIINSTDCDRSCGGNLVQHPFGFSDACKIKLNCSSGEIRIGDFTLRNLTSDQILINLPSDCSRPISDLSRLTGANFAPTWRNSLLLEGCSAPSTDCVVPTRMLNSRVGLESCPSSAGHRDNISCFWAGTNRENATGLFLDSGKLGEIGDCRVLYSSIMVDSGANASLGIAGNASSIALDFGVVELSWWVDGSCDCHPDASCGNVAYGRQQGFRCTCNQGFVGDGFADGNGCRRVSECSGLSSISGRCGNRVGILVGGIIAGACLAAALTALYYFVKRRNSSLNSLLSVRRLISEASGGGPTVPFFPFKEIERASNGFSEKQRLGTGAYGTVYAGKINNGDWVAIKKIRHRDHESVDQVMNEIKLLSSVSHPNLVRLLGCCIEHGEQILVYEYMPNGTLSQHLQRERGSILPWTVRLTIASQTAHAIAHLHSAMSPPIFHRDIKSSNILLDYNFNSKVADFGLSRFGMTDDSHISTAPQGTPGYVDPQYHQNFHLSDKSDVYSFGVVLVEIITAMKVVDFSRPHCEINLAALAVDRIGKGHMDEIVDPFLEPNRDAWTLSSVHKVAELAFRCLAFHRDMRPSMTEVADELDQIRRSGWALLDESVCPGSSVGSSCSSPYQGSKRSFSTKRAVGVGSRRLVVPQKPVLVGMPAVVTEEESNSSPVSIQDIWLSEQSSPSSNSLLGNVV